MTKPPSTIQVARWLAISLIVPLTTLIVTIAVMSIPPDTRGIDIAAGEKHFKKHCAACHFTIASHPAHNGPNLHDIGRFAGQRKPDRSAAEYLLESILDPSAFIAPSGRPGMPSDLVDELAPDEIRNLVGFLASRSAFPDYDAIKELDVPDRRSEEGVVTLISLQDMQLAESVLREKGSCLQCHSNNYAPENSTRAPGLFGVGLGSEKAIRDSIVDPHREVKLPYKKSTILLANGEIMSGQLMNRTDQHLVLCTYDDKNRLAIREIPLSEIEVEDGRLQIRESETSIMPKGFGELLSSREIDAVVKLIRQLN